MATNGITLRLPATHPATFTAPTTAWLAGTWHVTHSTLPMWKSKCNVTITYNPLPPSNPNDYDTSNASTNKLQDTVSYQTLTSDKIKTVNGVDTAAGGTDTGAWHWRGKGWLIIASSHWEVLGYGDLEDANQWAVTYFAKTPFTPAGVDVYSRRKEGMTAAQLEEIKRVLAGLEHEGVRKLAREMFEVVRR